MKKAIVTSTIIVTCYMVVWLRIEWFVESKIPESIIILYAAISIISTLAGYFIGHKVERAEENNMKNLTDAKKAFFLTFVIMACYISIWFLIDLVAKWQISLHYILGSTAIIIIGFLAGDKTAFIEITKSKQKKDEDELK